MAKKSSSLTQMLLTLLRTNSKRLLKRFRQMLKTCPYGRDSFCGVTIQRIKIRDQNFQGIRRSATPLRGRFYLSLLSFRNNTLLIGIKVIEGNARAFYDTIQRIIGHACFDARATEYKFR